MNTAVVTGSSRGIGAAICKKLCENGFSVAVNYREAEEKATILIKALQEKFL